MHNQEHDELHQKEALAFFSRHLDEIEWNYHYSKDQRTIFSGFNGMDAVWDFSAYAHTRGDDHMLLCVNSFIPNRVPAMRRTACVDLLTRINNDLAIGCFEFDLKEGNLRFRTSMILPFADITPGIVAILLRSNLSIVDERMKQILMVLHSNKSPEAVMKPKVPKPTNTKGMTQARFDLN